MNKVNTQVVKNNAAKATKTVADKVTNPKTEAKKKVAITKVIEASIATKTIKANVPAVEAKREVKKVAKTEQKAEVAKVVDNKPARAVFNNNANRQKMIENGYDGMIFHPLGKSCQALTKVSALPLAAIKASKFVNDAIVTAKGFSFKLKLDKDNRYYTRTTGCMKTVFGDMSILTEAGFKLVSAPTDEKEVTAALKDGRVITGVRITSGDSVTAIMNDKGIFNVEAQLNDFNEHTVGSIVKG